MMDTTSRRPAAPSAHGFPAPFRLWGRLWAALRFLIRSDERRPPDRRADALSGRGSGGDGRHAAFRDVTFRCQELR
ncbi:hypothetical protein SUDANB5_04090 [Streptomyces sp. SudanB5_2050]